MAIKEVILSGKQVYGLKDVIGKTKSKKVDESVKECGGQLTEDDEITLDGGDSLESAKEASDNAKSKGIKNFAVKTIFGESKKKNNRRKLGESVTLTWKELLNGKF